MKTKRVEKIFVSLFSFFFLASFIGGEVFAAEKAFPQKEIALIVGVSPGGGRDLLARGIAKTMGKYLNVPMVIVNEPGAGGARGLAHAYHATPDAYTLVVGAGNEVLIQILEKQDFDMTKYAYIGRAQSVPPFLFVKSDSPIKSMNDFKKFGKIIRHATFSLTATSTVAAMVVANREGFPIAVIGGYPSVGAATLSLIRGEVEFVGGQISSLMSYVQSGQIRPIVVFDNKRYPDFPNVPTIGEMGHKDLDVMSLDYWLMAPPQTPKNRIKILEDALMKTLKDPEFVKWAKGANVLGISPLSGEESAKSVLNLFNLLQKYKGDMEKYIKK